MTNSGLSSSDLLDAADPAALLQFSFPRPLPQVGQRVLVRTQDAYVRGSVVEVDALALGGRVDVQVAALDRSTGTARPVTLTVPGFQVLPDPDEDA